MRFHLTKSQRYSCSVDYFLRKVIWRALVYFTTKIFYFAIL